jgi:hypothetical protein
VTYEARENPSLFTLCTVLRSRYVSENIFDLLSQGYIIIWRITRTSVLPITGTTSHALQKFQQRRQFPRVPTKYPRRIAIMKPALYTRAHARSMLIKQATNSIADPPSRRPNNCPIGPQPSPISYKKDSLHLHHAFSDLSGVTRTRSHAGDLTANQVAG